MNNLEKNLRENIGRKIKLARKNAEFTQEELAEKLSLSPRYISQLERGIAFGSATTIINICKALNISSDFLFADLIKNTLPVNDISFDSEIISKYSKLNDYNKGVVDAIINGLIKLQKMIFLLRKKHKKLLKVYIKKN